MEAKSKLFEGTFISHWTDNNLLQLTLNQLIDQTVTSRDKSPEIQPKLAIERFWIKLGSKYSEGGRRQANIRQVMKVAQ